MLNLLELVTSGKPGAMRVIQLLCCAVWLGVYRVEGFLSPLEHLSKLPQLEQLSKLPPLEQLGKLPQLETLSKLPPLEYLGKLSQLEHLNMLEQLQSLAIAKLRPLENLAKLSRELRGGQERNAYNHQVQILQCRGCVKMGSPLVEVFILL